MSRKTKRVKTSSYIIVGIISVIVIAGGVFAVIALNHRGQSGSSSNNTVTDVPQTTVKQEVDPKDEEAVAIASGDVKDAMDRELEKSAEPQKKTESGLNQASPMISYVAEEDGFIAAGGMIPGTNETEGSCIYMFTSTGKTVSETAGILPGPKYISCEAVRLDKNKFSTGTWTLKIKYQSNTSEGESEAQSFEIK